MNKRLLLIVWMLGTSLIYLNIVLAQPNDLRVSGIIQGEEPIAVVNDRVVRKGDIVEGVEVVEISGGSVKFKYKDEIFVKYIGGDIAKPKKTEASEVAKSSVKTRYFSEIPNGYGKVEFGMSKEEVKQIVQEEKKVIIKEEDNYILTKGDVFTVEGVDEEVVITYSFTPITQKCKQIAVSFVAPSIEPYQLYFRVVTEWMAKYGIPEHRSGSLRAREGIVTTGWRRKKICIGVMLFEDEEHAAAPLVLNYMDMDLAEDK